MTTDAIIQNAFRNATATEWATWTAMAAQNDMVKLANQWLEV